MSKPVNPRHVVLFERLAPYAQELQDLAQTLNPASPEYEAVYDAYNRFERARRILLQDWGVAQATGFERFS